MEGQAKRSKRHEPTGWGGSPFSVQHSSSVGRDMGSVLFSTSTRPRSLAPPPNPVLETDIPSTVTGIARHLNELKKQKDYKGVFDEELFYKITAIKCLQKETLKEMRALRAWVVASEESEGGEKGQEKTCKTASCQTEIETTRSRSRSQKSSQTGKISKTRGAKRKADSKLKEEQPHEEQEEPAVSKEQALLTLKEMGTAHGGETPSLAFLEAQIESLKAQVRDKNDVIETLYNDIDARDRIIKHMPVEAAVNWKAVQQIFTFTE